MGPGTEWWGRGKHSGDGVCILIHKIYCIHDAYRIPWDNIHVHGSVKVVRNYKKNKEWVWSELGFCSYF